MSLMWLPPGSIVAQATVAFNCFACGGLPVTIAKKYVNMADVNFEQSVESPASERPAATRPAGSQPAQHYDLVELLFFAYRDFISDPDAILAEIGFGRAHHRVLHFVSRNPGLKVADLLDILKITKQSLGRVLKQLIDEGYIVQREGPSDRRQRLLYATEAGNALALRLARPQFQRFADAIAATGPDDAAAAKRFLMAVVDPRERAAVAALLKGGQGSSGRTLDER
ncbi:DNA-binding MarR family transcriptional regulator [Tepidamorphus gemmatus]|jgi:DNA-binding MarR family transcriptional regulator|uniref:DNA-binding MarR family transcriptional regulator n=2 Tax=Tepidamorphus gemmatus TaxID=747076 RepID=A0A4R3MNK9_9HYPH|nr:DNA-binding MarR family transcriptional regulator [Tepidamorphus gemmatus]